jgi:hypothetical protein
VGTVVGAIVGLTVGAKLNTFLILLLPKSATNTLPIESTKTLLGLNSVAFLSAPPSPISADVLAPARLIPTKPTMVDMIPAVVTVFNLPPDVSVKYRFPLKSPQTPLGEAMLMAVAGPGSTDEPVTPFPATVTIV